jgi:hypothetical protein
MDIIEVDPDTKEMLRSLVSFVWESIHNYCCDFDCFFTISWYRSLYLHFIPYMCIHTYICASWITVVVLCRDDAEQSGHPYTRTEWIFLNNSFPLHVWCMKANFALLNLWWFRTSFSKFMNRTCNGQHRHLAWNALTSGLSILYPA